MGLNKKFNLTIANHNDLAGRGVADAHPFSGITGLQDTLDGVTSGIAGVSDSVTALDTDFTTFQTNTSATLVDVGGDITGLEGRMTTAESDIDALQASIPPDLSASMAAAESDIGTLQTEMNTAQSDILSLAGGISTAQTSSYMIFMSSNDSNALDYAFGKNNIARVRALGRQLAMVAWGKGDSDVTYPFSNLILCDTITDIANSADAKTEIAANATLTALIKKSGFAMIQILAKVIYYNEGYVNPLLGTLQTAVTYDGAATIGSNYLSVVSLTTTAGYAIIHSQNNIDFGVGETTLVYVVDTTPVIGSSSGMGYKHTSIAGALDVTYKASQYNPGIYTVAAVDGMKPAILAYKNSGDGGGNIKVKYIFTI